MKDKYNYPPIKILYPSSLVLILPVASVYFWFCYDLYRNDLIFNSIYWLFTLGIGCTVSAWLANDLSVQISVDEKGISKKSIFTSESVNWEEIGAVQWKILFETGHNDLRKPNDLLIRARDGRKIQIYGIAQRFDGGQGGISELQAAIRARVGAIIEKCRTIRFC